MPYTAFHDYFPEVARRETRAITILSSSAFRLPPGEYGLLEMYCDEAGCDCRRVLFCVVTPRGEAPVAVVAYGWEPAEFYAEWARDDDPEVVHQVKGPVLNLASPQSRHAPEVLRLIEQLVLADSAYVERLEAHYEAFRRRVEEAPRRGRADRPRPRRPH